MSAWSLRTATAVAALLSLVGLPLIVFAQPAPDGGAALKAAAVARVNALAPGVPVVGAEIERVVGDWALVRVFPPPELTDPAWIFLRRQTGAWAAVAGPGTAFFPGDVPGAPDAIYPPFPKPYVGAEGQAAIAALPPGRQTYNGQGVVFQYAADAAVQADGGSLRLTGPASRSPLFQGPAYQITVTPLNVHSGPALDEWGYTRVQAETVARQASGLPNFAPVSATFYHASADVDIWQIDWFAGDSHLQDLYAAPAGGGWVIQISTRAYPVENNPNAPQAQGAVALLLQSLIIGRG